MSVDLALEDKLSRIREEFGDDSFDVMGAIEAGEITISKERAVLGFRSLRKVADSYIQISPRLWHRYFDYRDELALIEAATPEFLPCLRALRDLRAKKLFHPDKLRPAEPHHSQGRVMHPHAGYYLPILQSVAADLHFSVIQAALRPHLKGVDAVVDIGCGFGDVLCELAASNPDTSVHYYGAELAKTGLKCLELLAARLPNRKVQAIDFDLTAPSFGFAKGHKNVLFFSHGVLVCAKLPKDFWPNLLSSAESVRIVALEPVGYALTDAPLYSADAAKVSGFNGGFLTDLRALASAGRVEIEEIVPDISGPSAHYTASLIRARKLT